MQSPWVVLAQSLVLLSGTRRNLGRRLIRGHHVFDHGFSVQIRRPVNQVECPEENREHDAGHAVDFTHAVEGFLRLGRLAVGFGLSLFGYASLGNGGEDRVLGDVGGVVRHRDGIGVVLLDD